MKSIISKDRELYKREIDPFVRDWDFGHFFHYGNYCFNQWRAGDLWDLVPGVYHGSANAGLNPKITIHWSGEIK